MDEIKEKMEATGLDDKGAQQQVYCGICHMPPEYCEFMPSFPKCQEWLQEHHPTLFNALYTETATFNNSANTVATASSKRAGKAQVRDESLLKERQAQARAQAQVIIRTQDRNKRKTLTIVKGLEEVGLDLKKVAKRLAGRFACGAAVTEDVSKQGLEITIQGDVASELADFLPKEYPNNLKPAQIHIQ